MELLLIEDDPLTCEVLSLLLTADGWQVTTAGSGEAALTCLQEASTFPALILCDQKLPGLSGSSLAEAIRSTYRETVSAPVRLFAISASRGIVPDGYEALLTKPFSASDVRKLFEQVPLQADAPNGRPEARADDVMAFPVIDKHIFKKLLASMGTERLRDLYLFAMADAADRVHRIQSALAAGREDEMAKEAHMLKGAAGMVGARRLADLAQVFETQALADSETTEFYKVKMAMLTAALDDIQLMLKTLFPARK